MAVQQGRFDENGELHLYVTPNLSRGGSHNTPHNGSNTTSGTTENGIPNTSPNAPIGDNLNSTNRRSPGGEWNFSFNSNGGAGGGFSGGFGGSSRKKAKKRARARAQAIAKQREALAAAQRQAEADERARQEQADLAHRRHVEALAARAHAEAAARAQAEKEHAYRHTLNSLTEAFQTERQDSERRYAARSASQPESIVQGISANYPYAYSHNEQQLLDLMLQENVQIKALIAMKRAERDATNDAIATSGVDASNPDPERHRQFLETHSHGDEDRAYQLHRRWNDAYTRTYESQLLAQAISLLEERSAQLAMQHAELSHEVRSAQEVTESATAKQANTLWKAIAPPALSATAVGTESIQARVAQIAKEHFVRIASKALARNVGLALAAYAPNLADAERPSSIVATPVSQLHLPETLDLAYIASVGGTIDVPHRLVESTDGERALAQWTATDGVKLSTKVRVRTFTYNAQNNTYEFTRDGESTPALVWTPIARPTDSSTVSPLNLPALPADPGKPVTPVAPALETYPEIDRNDPDDYILVSPIDSDLPNTYLLFKGPRSTPGVASGYGAPVEGNWLKDAASSQGAPIPSSIADQLRGQKFRSFNKLRKAIWLAVSKDPELSRDIGVINLRELSKTRAPYALPKDRIGRRVKLEIHHKHWIGKGGAVYDLDNLTIMTPKEHIQAHRKIRP